MKKEDALVQLEILQKEVNKLKSIINKPVDILERVFTWEDVCKEDGICPIESLPYKTPQTRLQRKINAVFKIDKTSSILNEGFVFDWKNTHQRKWYVWYRNPTSSGWVFDESNCYGYYSNGQVAFFKTQDILNHYVKYFNNVQIEYLNNM